MLELEHINCDLCGSEDYTVIYRKPDNWLWLNQYEYPVVKCCECGLVYVNPRPSESSMLKYYPDGYHDNREVAYEETRYESQYNIISDFKPKTILDIGCARGDFLAYYNKRNPQALLFGCDPYSDKVNYEFINFNNEELISCNYSNNYFDLITSWAVFEHIYKPIEYFMEVSKILTLDGKLVILVTNANSCYGKFAFSEDIPRHTYHYSIDSLTQYAIKSGMVIENIIFTDSIFNGKGFGTFRYSISRLVGYSWEKRYFNKSNIIHRTFESFGKILDYFAFTIPWERKFKVSGIMVAVFRKVENTS